jgi:hypothetical protein
MTKLFECNICFSNKRNTVRCFHKCRAVVCRGCFRKLIGLNQANEISYCCPVCRQESVRKRDKKFTFFCNKGTDLLKTIIALLENEIKLEKEHNLGVAWTNFQAQIMDHDTDDDITDFNPSSNPTTNELFRLIDEDLLPVHLRDLFTPRRRLQRSNSL